MGQHSVEDEDYLEYLMAHLLSLYYVSSSTSRIENILDLLERSHFFSGENSDLDLLSNDINFEVQYLKEFDELLHQKYLNSFHEYGWRDSTRLEIEKILIRSHKISKIFGDD